MGREGHSHRKICMRDADPSVRPHGYEARLTTGRSSSIARRECRHVRRTDGQMQAKIDNGMSRHRHRAEWAFGLVALGGYQMYAQCHTQRVAFTSRDCVSMSALPRHD